MKKGSPSNSLPKTFNIIFSAISPLEDLFCDLDILEFSGDMAEKILKVFGKGSGEEPFLRKVCPSILPQGRKANPDKVNKARSSFKLLRALFLFVLLIRMSFLLQDKRQGRRLRHVPAASYHGHEQSRSYLFQEYRNRR